MTCLKTDDVKIVLDIQMPEIKGTASAKLDTINCENNFLQRFILSMF
jgi:hypothetical protein